MATKSKKTKTTGKAPASRRPKKKRQRQPAEAPEESLSILSGTMKSVIRDAFLQRGQ